MLIFTRRAGEDIIIGDDIIIKTLGINRNQVRYAIVAPKHIPVDRIEIRRRKNAEKERLVEQQ